MEKTLAEKIQHAEERVSHHSAKNFEWLSIMNKRENQYETARDKLEFHATKVEEWGDDLILLQKQQEKELGYTNAVNKITHIISVLDGLPQTFYVPALYTALRLRRKLGSYLTEEEQKVADKLWDKLPLRTNKEK